MALSAPHEGDEEIVFPQTLRPAYMSESCGVVWCGVTGWDGTECDGKGSSVV